MNPVELTRLEARIVSGYTPGLRLQNRETLLDGLVGVNSTGKMLGPSLLDEKRA